METVREFDIVPQGEVVPRDFGRFGGGRPIMEGDVPTDFEGAAVAVRVSDPNEVPFCIFCISEESARFSAWVEFREVG